MMVSESWKCALVLLAATLPGRSDAFYVPGVQPLTFKNSDEVPLKVNSLTSYHTQIPKDYYRLPFCQPKKGVSMASESLGEFLTGNKIQNSPYVINMRDDVNCRIVCQRTFTNLEAAKLRLHIKYGYHNNWIIDNLPSAHEGTYEGKPQKHYAGGFPIGFFSADGQTANVYNHVNIHLEFHAREDGNRVVGFSVEPMSINHKFADKYEWDGEKKEGFSKRLETCPSGKEHTKKSEIKEYQVVNPDEVVLYTYDVIWTESEVAWSSRWDVYLSEGHSIPPQVHWYSITNSILVVLFLSLLVVSILVRNLRRDIAAYNALSQLADEEKDEDVDETGWKLIHADVFRPPENFPMLYCVFLGTGSQLGLTTMASICFSAIGFLSPARRGSLMTATLVFYMLTGTLSGYASSRVYKAFRGRQWQLCTVLTALLFPGTAFILFILCNVAFFFRDSTVAAPLLDVIIVAAMWCCVQIPLTFLGAYFGYKAEVIEFPTVTSTIARAIPETPLLLNPMVGMTLTGIIPFAAAYVELFFIMSSLWMDQFYYVFGFTLLVYIILLVTCAEVTLLSVYYQLCAENHRWWWYSFFCSGSTALYMFLYSIVWFRTLHASKLFMTYMLYFGYMTLICFAMMTVFGTTGTLTSFWFIHKIFSTIKVD